MLKNICVVTTICFLISFFIILGIDSVKAKDEPCKADLEKFCQGVQPGEGRIAKCLNEHEAELSQECKASMKSSTMEAKEVVDAFSQACGKDVETLCKGVPPGEGRIAKCLTEHEAELSQECKASIKSTTKEIKDGVDAFTQACGKDVETLCTGIKPGKGRIAKCLKEHEAELSQECKAFLNM